ncbi:MAG: hypothetical protein ABI910_03545 [Gemmatimonadota bacterium]
MFLSYYTVTSGTGRFAAASGQLMVHAARQNIADPASPLVSEIEGTIVFR